MIRRNVSALRKTSLISLSLLSVRQHFLLFVALFSMMTGVNASEISSNEIKLVSNSLKYVHGLKNEKPVPIAVIYDPENAESTKEANSFIKVVGSGSKNLAPKLVPVSELGTLTGIELAYVTMGMDSHYETIFQISKANKLFTLSRDEACVRGRCCILSFSLKSGLDIYLNEATMREVGYEVDAAFRFMVRRV